MIAIETSSLLHAAELKAHTVKAFDLYAFAREEQIQQQIVGKDAFLCLDQIGSPENSSVERDLRRGNVFVYRPGVCSANHRLEVPDGLIHHWIAVIYLKGAMLPDVLAILQDYDSYRKIYAPDVEQSKALQSSEQEYRIQLRL